MANVEPKVILQLLGEVDNSENIDGVSDMTKGKLVELRINAIRVAMKSRTARFDAARHSRLSAGRQKEIFSRLTAVGDELIDGVSLRTPRPVADTEPGDSVSNKSIIWLTVFGFIFAAILLALIR